MRGGVIAINLGRTDVIILERVGTRRIETFEHVEILSHEIAIREFTKRSGPFILVDTWKRSAPSGIVSTRRNPSVNEVHRESPDRKVIHRKSRFEKSGIGKSEIPEAKVSCMGKSRYAISR
jgi:hypothetical protein